MDSQRIMEGLLRKGFIQKNRHHKIYKYISRTGIESKISTMIGHGSKHDISHDIISKMADQCFLTKREFLNLIKCPLSRDEYETKMVASGKIVLNKNIA